MPARSPDEDPLSPVSQALGSSAFPERDYLESGDLATRITQVADGQAAELEALHALDPDQVPDIKVKRRLGFAFWIATSWVLLVSALALLAPILPIDNPDAITGLPQQGPSSAHWLGTDTLGRDQLSRLIWGGRVSLTVGISAILFALLIGGSVGVIAGFYKGFTETGLMGAMDVLLAFPALLLALVIITFTNQHTVPYIAFAIGVVSIAPVSLVSRASTLVFTEREFVLASRALGGSNRRIIVREILPNVILPVLSFAIIGIAIAIVAEGGLAFLGLSVAPPQATWGGMINEGRAVLDTDPYISLLPCFVMFLTVLSLNLAGDRVREFFDVKEGGL